MPRNPHTPPTYIGDGVVIMDERDLLQLAQYAAWYGWGGIQHCRKNKINADRYEECYTFVGEIRKEVRESKDNYTWKPNK
jgi:hypothetical protein